MRHISDVDLDKSYGGSAWWDGRAVGCWVQDPDGVVEVRSVEVLPGEARAALDAEAVRLTEWLRGQRVSTVCPSPVMKEPR